MSSIQTFLPVPSFWGSATLLDRGRLGKQRSENMQIMEALTDLRVNKETGEVEPYLAPASIRKHWVTGMWRGHESWLMGYQNAVCREWTGRGYADTCFGKTAPLFAATGYREDPRPEWLGHPEFHEAHRRRLVAKDPGLYHELFPGATPVDDYYFRWRE